jgi:uncharacterized protein (DUF488 family)
MSVLYTAGYQGHTIETFLDLLAGNGVEHLIDVRQLPFSRKPDFSKKRLAAHLAAAGVRYTHLVALGTPKPLRDEVRRSKDYAAFFAAVCAPNAACCCVSRPMSQHVTASPWPRRCVNGYLISI